MLVNSLIEFYTQDLNKLKSEIELYQTESNLWVTQADIANSAGNLCLHLTGNLNAFIGVGLADSGYVRDRVREFSAKDVSRQELISDIENTIEVVRQGLSTVSDDRLQDEFPIKIWKEPKTIYFTITRLHAHFNYHLGQINYHRRLVDA